MGYSATSIGQWTDWSPTFTGFASAPNGTITSRYTLNGKLCTCYVRMASQTVASNATTFTITLPFAAANTAAQYFSGGFYTNNGSVAAVPPLIGTRVNSNVADLYTTSAAAGWTAANAKSINFSITYEIA